MVKVDVPLQGQNSDNRKSFMRKDLWLRRVAVCLCASSLFTPFVTAETSQERTIGIDELFRLAESANKKLKTSKSAFEVALENVKAAKAEYLPDVSLQMSVSYIGDGYLWDRDFTNGMTAEIPHFGNNFSIEASQVIYAGGALRAGVSMAELSREMAALDTERERQQMRFLLVGQYLDLYKLHNQARVYERNIALTEKVIENVRSKQEQGTALRNDITRYELQLEDLKLALVRVNNECEILNYRLCNAIGISTETRILPDTMLLSVDYPTGSVDEWQRTALFASPSLKQASLGIDMAKEQVKLERAAMIPHIALVIADKLDGPILIEVPPLDKNLNYWYVGVGVNFNIGALYKNNRRVRSAQVGVKRSSDVYAWATEQLENDVQADFLRYRQSFVELRTQQKSVELANQNYGVINNRYLNDLALVTDMVDAADAKLSAELLEVNARINVIYAYYKMKYTSGTL